MALGVTNLKAVLGSILTLANKVDGVLQDGLQPLQDALALLPNVLDVVTAMKNGKAAWQEYNDLDDAEKADVEAFVQKTFNIAEDKVEAVVDSAFAVIFDVGELVEQVKLIK
jgi:hypothetical protein